MSRVNILLDYSLSLSHSVSVLSFAVPSGTYNNQYMLVDVSKVSLGSRLDDGALTIVEQIPGLVEYSDQTEALRFGEVPLNVTRGTGNTGHVPWSFSDYVPLLQHTQSRVCIRRPKTEGMLKQEGYGMLMWEGSGKALSGRVMAC